MTTPTIAVAKDLDRESLKTLSDCTGTCLTLVLPDSHPGAPEGARRKILRGLLKDASELVASGPAAPQASSLLEPLEELCEDPSLDAGGRGLAIFRAPDFFACYRVWSNAERLSIASHFLLSPFITDALLPAELFVLGLSLKRLQLFRCTRTECQEIALPEGVPPSLREAGQFDRGERTLENRSAAGSSTGDMRRVRFGTTSDREASGAYIHDFFEIVQRGLKPFLAGRPLVIMGVREEIAAYRRSLKDGPPVLAGEPGNIEFLSPAEVGRRARDVALADYVERGDRVLAKLREMTNRSRVATGVREVLRAAAEGRVHELCVRAETQFAQAKKHGEDLINVVIAETLRTSGDVYVLPQDRLPAAEPLAAVLRYE